MVVSLVHSSSPAFEVSFGAFEEVDDLARKASRYFPDPERAYCGMVELMINALEHGCLGITNEEKRDKLRSGEWPLYVQTKLAEMPPSLRAATLSVWVKYPGSSAVRISDSGRGFDWKPYLTPLSTPEFHPNGRGILIARAVAFDELSYNEQGNVVTAVQYG